MILSNPLPDSDINRRYVIVVLTTMNLIQFYLNKIVLKF